MQELRKGPAHFVLHSDKYWRAVANQTVRSYVTLLVEPKTQAAVQQAVSQSPVSSVPGTCLTLLDTCLLGESTGPNSAEGLRKKHNPSEEVLRKLVQGAMLARGVRPKEDGQATSPPEGDVVLIHLGDKPKKEIRPLFCLRTARRCPGLRRARHPHRFSGRGSSCPEETQPRVVFSALDVAGLLRLAAHEDRCRETIPPPRRMELRGRHLPRESSAAQRDVAHASDACSQSTVSIFAY